MQSHSHTLNKILFEVLNKYQKAAFETKNLDELKEPSFQLLKDVIENVFAPEDKVEITSSFVPQEQNETG